MVWCLTQMKSRARQRLHNSLARSTRPARCRQQGARADRLWSTTICVAIKCHKQIMKLFLKSPLPDKKAKKHKETTNTPCKTTFKRRTLSHCPCTISRSRSRSDAHVEGTKFECPAVSQCPTDGSAWRWSHQWRSQNGRPYSESPGRLGWLLEL